MDSHRATRREMLQAGMSLAGSSLLTQLFPRKLDYAAQQAASVPADRAAAFRAQMGSIPIQAQKLADRITMLSRPGGNVAVLDGPDGKVVVDTFVSPAWPKLKETLEGMGKAPVKYVIDTHWHLITPTITRPCTPPEQRSWQTRKPNNGCRRRTN